MMVYPPAASSTPAANCSPPPIRTLIWLPTHQASKPRLGESAPVLPGLKAVVTVPLWSAYK